MNEITDDTQDVQDYFIYESIHFRNDHPRLEPTMHTHIVEVGEDFEDDCAV